MKRSHVTVAIITIYSGNVNLQSLFANVLEILTFNVKTERQAGSIWECKTNFERVGNIKIVRDLHIYIYLYTFILE